MDTNAAAPHNLPPPPTAAFNTTGSMHHHMMMHMTFYWGKDALVLFRGWPGTSLGMYALSLIFVFAMAFLLEWMPHFNFGSNSSMLQTVVYAIRSGMSYMVMLAVMSFNVGIFVAAVAGHALGFLVFGSRVSKKDSDKGSDLSGMKC